ncbi:hypothetical protein CHLNCDRAFT_136492 [Chlorella variabilis]|uniref:Uncharacterized protein n=1 Tax=Chlorella variabilis TaxID=554065 RepID=E1ZKG5_CHLVA|nr:hypothetical protein CHLNCDRAFT_136492 [Chlorella variabilis]EFN53802.1 hypothetical protein CHLNCDRAFT_136492 [Chlorella variabilis]|eukprot:XP_005845904.1 hypothetical protein CHLNCDRAFT_136492 [Chlorella variabilis]
MAVPQAAPAAEEVGAGQATAFTVAYGGYDNYYRSDDVVAGSQPGISTPAPSSFAGVLLLTQPGVRLPDGAGVRFLAAFPDANSGAVAYFNATEGPSTDLVIELDNTTFTSTMGPGNTVGLTGTLVFNRNATLYRAVVGSIRTVRDYVEGPRIIRPIFAHTTTQQDSSVVLHREYMNGTGSNTLVFAPADDSTELTLLPDGNFTVGLVPGAPEGRVAFTVLVSWSPHLRSFQPDQLLAEGQRGIANTPQVTQLSFLTYPEKLLAGSWRFLTYFGRRVGRMRDSLIAARLMMSRLASAATEAALGAALANLNLQQGYYQYNGQDFIPVGTVCHEETLGDYASWTNIQEGTPELGGRLWCDYKMIDTDFLLLPFLAQYFLNTSQGADRAPAFLESTVPPAGGTALNLNSAYGELLDANANLVLELARPFATNQTVDTLISLRPGQLVGNWRDSEAGLGMATIPYDVNTALVPAALRAIQELAAAGILDPAMEAEAAELATVWETQTAPFFEITVPAAEAEEMVGAYSRDLGVPSPVTRQAGSTAANLTFYALALHPNGTQARWSSWGTAKPSAAVGSDVCDRPLILRHALWRSMQVPVMHSDVGFNLLYQSNVPEEIIRSVPTLLSEFPGGLLTPAGMVVANPAYSALASPPVARQLYANTSAGAYHGTVVWGFQQALMVEGVERQLALCQSASPPDWCDDQNLVDELRAALDRLCGVITSNPTVAFSEASPAASWLGTMH